jgi:hypothetical protein
MPLTAPRFMIATSIDCERWSSILIGGSDLGGSSRLLPQCCASSDLLSSIGVKILCALAAAGKGIGCGSGGLLNWFCGGCGEACGCGVGR